jgi:hypothetical protein
VFDLGLFFRRPTRFFRPFDEKFHAAGCVRVPVVLKMQLRDMPEAQADTQFVPQIMPRVIERIQGFPLLALLPSYGYANPRMASIRADVHVRNVYISKPRVIQFEPNDLDQFLPNRLRYPQCASLIHKHRGRGPGARGRCEVFPRLQAPDSRPLL